MYNILVCDDEKDIVSALRIYLTAEGYRVFEAGNGAEALEVIDREDIHLALLDVMMPAWTASPRSTVCVSTTTCPSSF